MASSPSLLTDDDLEIAAGDVRAYAEAVRERRGGQLLNLDRMLLHSLPFARGWSALLGPVRNELDLPSRLRELVICKVSRLTGAEYEYRLHSRLLLSMGVGEDLLAALDEPQPDPRHFDEPERLALCLASEMTCRIDVDPALRGQLLKSLGERRLVELVGLIATYNMVSRFLVALDVQLEA